MVFVLVLCLWVVVGVMVVVVVGFGLGFGFGDFLEGFEVEVLECWWKVYGMLKFYYGFFEGEVVGCFVGFDFLDFIDFNGVYFDLEVYLDKVCLWGVGVGGLGFRYIVFLYYFFDFVVGVREVGVYKDDFWLG